MAALSWIDDERFRIGATTFLTTGMDEFASVHDLLNFAGQASTVEEFVLLKSPGDVARYVELADTLQPRTVFELGIFKGGSTAFLAELMQPDHLVAIEFDAARVEALDRFVGARGLDAVVKTFYGVDQADRRGLLGILESELAGGPLDLVVDDASHFLDETRRSFNTLFPHLRPGGVYVIEDWSWAHAYNYFQLDKPPLTPLIFEVVVACAQMRGVIERVVVDWNVAFVTRGQDEVPADGFDIAAPYRAARDLLAAAEEPG